MNPMTDKQQEIYDFVVRFIAEKGWAPTRAEIGENFGYGANNAVEQLKAIEKKGYIALGPGIGRGIRVLDDLRDHSWAK